MASLQSMPADLLFMILSHLKLSFSNPRRHELVAFSLTCKALHLATEEFANHELVKLQTRNERPPALPKSLRSNAAKLSQYLTRFCAFCANRTTEHAKLYPEIRCCRTCDAQQWPKVTLTYATKTYNLTGQQLKENVHHGKYTCFNVLTTVFLHADVKRYAESVHGSLSDFLELKQKRKAKRAASAAERTRVRREELRATLRLNGIDPATCYNRLQWDVEHMAPEAIVRRQILNNRIQNEGRLGARISRLTAAGYSQLFDTMVPLQLRLPNTLPTNPDDPLDGFDERFPTDEALADMFVNDFGPLPDGGTTMPAEIYRKFFDVTEWNPAFREVLSIGQFGSFDLSTHPWSFSSYPVLVKKVYIAPEGRSQKQNEKAQKRVEQLNAQQERDFERVKWALRRLLSEGAWTKPREMVDGLPIYINIDSDGELDAHAPRLRGEVITLD